MRVQLFRSLMHVGLAGLLAVLVGCGTTQEVKNARSAVESARSAGKDKECPSEFQAVDQQVQKAEALCQQCKTQEANALANDALAKSKGLCPAKPTPPPAPPAAPRPPTVSLSAASTSIEQGACTTLNWTTSNAKSTSIDQGVGAVDASGSRQVCPTSTTRYTLTANGDGGTRSDSATVNVAAKPTPTDKLTIHVNFETNKSDIRKADVSDLQKAEAFVKKYSAARSRSTATRTRPVAREINQPLSERRADAVKKWLLDHGATSATTSRPRASGRPIRSPTTRPPRAASRTDGRKSWSSASSARNASSSPGRHPRGAGPSVSLAFARGRGPVLTFAPRSAPSSNG